MSDVSQRDEFRNKFAKEYLAEIKRTLDSIEDDLIDKIDKIASVLKRARANKKTIFVMGNGGSAATALPAGN
jgi:phosphoheptose isomerase